MDALTSVLDNLAGLLDVGAGFVNLSSGLGDLAATSSELGGSGNIVTPDLPDVEVPVDPEVPGGDLGDIVDDLGDVVAGE